MKKKIAILALAFVLVFALGIGGTLAWLTATSDTVTNTFTVGDVNIELKETSGSNYDLVPGYTYNKDPKVTVKANSVDCYLFVEFKEENVKSSDGSVSYLTYTSNLKAPDWTQGTGEDGNGVPANVWFRKVDSNTTDTTYELLKATNNVTVTVPDTLTKENIKELTDAGNKPTLTYKAYACQLYKTNKPTGDDVNETPLAAAQFTPAEAWAKLNPSSAG